MATSDAALLSKEDVPNRNDGGNCLSCKTCVATHSCEHCHLPSYCQQCLWNHRKKVKRFHIKCKDIGMNWPSDLPFCSSCHKTTKFKKTSRKVYAHGGGLASGKRFVTSLAHIDEIVLLKAGIVFLRSISGDPLYTFEKHTYFCNIMRDHGWSEENVQCKQAHLLGKSFCKLVYNKERAPWEIFQAALSCDRRNPPQWARKPVGTCQSEKITNPVTYCHRLVQILRGFRTLDIASSIIGVFEQGDAFDAFSGYRLEYDVKYWAMFPDQVSKLKSLFQGILEYGWQSWIILRAAYYRCFGCSKYPIWASVRRADKPEYLVPKAKRHAEDAFKPIVSEFREHAKVCAALVSQQMFGHVSGELSKLASCQDVHEVDGLNTSRNYGHGVEIGYCIKSAESMPSVLNIDIATEAMDIHKAHGIDTHDEDSDNDEFAGCFEGAEIVMADMPGSCQLGNTDRVFNEVAYKYHLEKELDAAKHQRNNIADKVNLEKELAAAKQRRDNIADKLRLFIKRHNHLLNWPWYAEHDLLVNCQIPKDIRPYNRITHTCTFKIQHSFTFGEQLSLLCEQLQVDTEEPTDGHSGCLPEKRMRSHDSHCFEGQSYTIKPLVESDLQMGLLVNEVDQSGDDLDDDMLDVIQSMSQDLDAVAHINGQNVSDDMQ